VTAAPNPIDESAEAEGLQVLVVEDSDSERWLISEILRSRGHSVTACESAESGWEQFQEHTFPLVLLDWVLPGMSGLDLCRKIREHPRGDECVVMIVTGQDRPDVLEEVLEAGADDYVAKPVEVGRLNVRLGLGERSVREMARRMATSQALESTSLELKTLFHNLNEVVFSVDLVEQRLIQVSPAVERIFGVPSSVLLSRPDLWPEFLYPDGWLSVQTGLDGLAEGDSLVLEYGVDRPDGGHRWIEARLKPERAEDGTLLRLDGVLTDQSSEQEARRELAERNDELVALYRAAEVTQSAGSIREACDEVLKELIQAGHAQAAWVGYHEVDSNLLRLLGFVGGEPGWEPPESVETQMTLEAAVLRTGQWIEVDDVRNEAKDLHDLYHDLEIRQLCSFPLRSEGELLGVLTLARSDTAGFPDQALRLARGIAHHLSGFLRRKATEGAMEESQEDFKALADQLQTVNQELEAFTYTVSHDLRAPLRTMQGFAHALLRHSGADLDPQAQDYARRIIASGESLESLIADLLDYSRLSFEELELQTVELSDVVTEAIEQVQAYLKEAGAEVAVDGKLPAATGNHRTLVQVVSNLVSNAAKFVPADRTPEIKISVKKEAESVRLWVRDNGSGIPEDQLERIFRTFERGLESQSQPGTGIGLAIVRKGMERIGGSVGVESRPGSGSAFWLDIPDREASKSRTAWRRS